jgi:hypothetical protein
LGHIAANKAGLIPATTLKFRGKTMDDKNEFVNNQLKKNEWELNQPYYYQRYGTCDYQKCQSACCRFSVYGPLEEPTRIINKSAKDYHELINTGKVITKWIRGKRYELYPTLCEHLKIEGVCKLHDSKRQCTVCKYFPMHPCDGVYHVVKHVCGYKFRKVRRKKTKDSSA